ncbi:MAG TPA: glycoside hydrolase family 88 protein [Terrimesophilobacter sp.]|nr:glycoside hydrolase family 88 protein [Terrimesophilobacter sp.]
MSRSTALLAIVEGVSSAVVADAPIHRDLSAFVIGPTSTGEATLRLRWSGSAPAGGGALRLVVARDRWAAGRLEFSVLDGGVVGSVDVDHPDSFEFIEIPVGDLALSQLFAHGGQVALVGSDEPVHVFGAASEGAAAAFAPRLLIESDKEEEPILRLLDALDSPSSLQQFGWKLGCVLDGLVDLSESTGDRRFLARARSHLGEFLDDDELVYQDPWGRPRRGEIYGIEGLLPFASMARSGIATGVPGAFGDYLEGARRADGALWDNAMISAEGAYTVAYPLALLSPATDGIRWLEDAASQLRVRIRELRSPGSVILRRFEDGSTAFEDWIRAWTWMLLGLARTIPLLRGRVQTGDLEQEFTSLTGEALDLRGSDGLWRVYPRDGSTSAETSGSAGIAAAMAIGARHGLVEDSYLREALRTRQALSAQVRADGMLGGASQANKGGERLQRSGHRILSQVGMGLFAQLLAATEGHPAGRRL